MRKLLLALFLVFLMAGCESNQKQECMRCSGPRRMPPPPTMRHNPHQFSGHRMGMMGRPPVEKRCEMKKENKERKFRNRLRAPE